MNIEDKVLIGLLRLSVEHNSSVTALASIVAGTMAERKVHDKTKVIESFKDLDKNYRKEYDLLIQQLSNEIHK